MADTHPDFGYVLQEIIQQWAVRVSSFLLNDSLTTYRRFFLALESPPILEDMADKSNIFKP